MNRILSYNDNHKFSFELHFADMIRANRTRGREKCTKQITMTMIDNLTTENNQWPASMSPASKSSKSNSLTTTQEYQHTRTHPNIHQIVRIRPSPRIPTSTTASSTRRLTGGGTGVYRSSGTTEIGPVASRDAAGILQAQSWWRGTKEKPKGRSDLF